MKALTALIWREFLEHRGAFFIAPTLLLMAFALMLALGAVFNPAFAPNMTLSYDAATLYEIALGGVYMVWNGYMLIALLFYFGDSFSADRRNNALLFWKSMPQSDFKILGAKALASISIFLALIGFFALVAGILVYFLFLFADAKLPLTLTPDPGDALRVWGRMGVLGTLFILVHILWYAPFLGFVAGLSTLFQRWSIPLACLLPALFMLAEAILGIGKHPAMHPVRDYLFYRLDGPAEKFGDQVLGRFVRGYPINAWELFREFLARLDWGQMALGLFIALLFVYLASEYRRRFIEA